MPVNSPSPRHQLRVKRGPTVKPHHERNARLVQLAVGQHLGLAIGNRLNRVLGVAQKFIAFAQFTDHSGRQIALPLQNAQHFEQRALLQAQVSPPVNQLEGLSNEFDLANPARPQLDVVGHAFAPHFLLNQLLHGAQRFNRRKIEIAPVHERAQQIEQLRAHDLIACHHAGLDHRVTLPVAALVLVILLQRIEAQHQRPGRAIRTQTHVDAEYKTVDGHGVQRFNQALAQPNEELLIVQRALGADRFAPFGVGEDQVDVRRQVQLHRPELAHAQNHHRLGLAAALPDRCAELLAMTFVQPAISLIDAGIGHVRQVAAGFDQVRLAGQVAPNDAHLLPRALATQHASQLLIGLRLLHSGSNLPAQLARREVTVQLTEARQLQQHQRVA